jgi:acetyltransferase-like isoleucine patch superfamily enzyme
MGAKLDTHKGEIEIGSYCHITYGCVVLAHDGAAKQIHGLTETSGKVVIEDYVFIGVNSVILNNVRIGHHSVVAAGSVVREDVPPYTLVAGNPAKIVKALAPATGVNCI